MASLSGNIIDADGNPMEDVIIELRKDGEVITTETDEDGDFVHEAIPKGKHTVKVISYGYLPMTEEMEFTTNDEKVKDFVLEKDPSINIG